MRLSKSLDVLDRFRAEKLGLESDQETDLRAVFLLKACSFLQKLVIHLLKICGCQMKLRGRSG